MIGWLEGGVQQLWQRGGRRGVLLNCGGVGYEVVLHQRCHDGLAAARPQVQGEPLRAELFTHLQVRDDGWTLYGFATEAERDLFRELIAVSGVGPQLGLALLGFFELPELVQALVGSDLARLSRAPGVGKRTAERLAVELRRKLAERFAGFALGEPLSDLDPAQRPAAEIGQDVELTLSALGYSAMEIRQALAAVAAAGAAVTPEDWIGACLAWLAQHGQAPAA